MGSHTSFGDRPIHCQATPLTSLIVLPSKPGYPVTASAKVEDGDGQEPPGVVAHPLPIAYREKARAASTLSERSYVFEFAVT